MLPLPVVMTWIWLNMPLAVVFVAFTVGLPLWVIFKFPEDGAPEASPRQVLPHEQSSVSVPDGEVPAEAAREMEHSAA